MHNTLNELALRYIKENGVKQSFFANYIGYDNTTVSKWLNGKVRISNCKLEKIHDFLNGKYLRTIDDIMNTKKEENYNDDTLG